MCLCWNKGNLKNALFWKCYCYAAMYSFRIYDIIYIYICIIPPLKLYNLQYVHVYMIHLWYEILYTYISIKRNIYLWEIKK